MTLLAVGPLIAAAGAGVRPTLAVAVLATTLALVALTLDGPLVLQDGVRVVTVLVVSILAVLLAAAARTARAADRRGPLGQPAGRGDPRAARRHLRPRARRARLPRPRRPLRARQRPPRRDQRRARRRARRAVRSPSAARAAGGRRGRPSRRADRPRRPPASKCGADARRSRASSTSGWPRTGPSAQRRRASRSASASVVFDVTARRVAERELRTQTDRYETLLTALSEVGEGMVVSRTAAACTPTPPSSGSAATRPGARRDGVGLRARRARGREEAARRARLRARGRQRRPAYALACAGATAAASMLELGGRPAGDRRTAARRQLVVVVRDVTARRRAEDERERLLARSALLAEASALFDQSLDEERDAAQHRRAVRARPRGLLRRPARHASRPGAAEIAVAARPGARAELLAAARRRRRRPDRGGPAHGRAEHRRRRASIVPLSARGRVLGALAAGFDGRAAAGGRARAARGPRPARRAGAGQRAAVRGARARRPTLQRSLLPPDLPRIPGAQVAARYLAAGDGIEVGGDFYDCFATGGGDWALVIGDVCGKGAEAAAITALARYTLRASVLHSRRPAPVLGRAQRGAPAPRARLPLLHGALRVGHAAPRRRRRRPGHGRPPAAVRPARRTGGRARGRAGHAAGHHARAGDLRGAVALTPGDTLVLYTDGVIEADPVAAALAPERLAQLLGTFAGRDAGAIAEAVEARRSPSRTAACATTWPFVVRRPGARRRLTSLGQG